MEYRASHKHIHRNPVRAQDALANRINAMARCLIAGVPEEKVSQAFRTDLHLQHRGDHWVALVLIKPRHQQNRYAEAEGPTREAALLGLRQLLEGIPIRPWWTKGES